MRKSQPWRHASGSHKNEISQIEMKSAHGNEKQGKMANCKESDFEPTATTGTANRIPLCC
jgi:hypothetical protein